MAKKSPAPKEPAVMVAVATTEPVRHDGEDIPVGTELEMEAKAAEALIASGAAVPVLPQPPAPSPDA